MHEPVQGDGLIRLFRKAIEAAQASPCLAGHWPDLPRGRLAVLAVGKAAGAMAFAAAEHYGPGVEGLVVLPDGHLPTNQLPPGLGITLSAHPVPDARSVGAADAALRLAAGLGPEDLLLVLLSGGGSSLVCKPSTGVSLQDKQALTRALHASGANISEINVVRKQLSAIKGGRLAAASGAAVVTLAISDVPGDDPSLIASGPTVTDHSTRDDALEILDRYAIALPPSVASALQEPNPVHPRKTGAGTDEYTIVASGATMLESARAECERLGYRVIDLGDAILGDARALAGQHANMALDLARTRRGCCILSGGEASVVIESAAGLGGRNTEYLLALALALDGAPGVWALAGDSDGIDGRGDHAGAVTGPDTLRRARERGLDPHEYLRNHDTATFFRALGSLVVTGPTLTNVNDFRAILIG